MYVRRLLFGYLYSVVECYLYGLIENKSILVIVGLEYVFGMIEMNKNIRNFFGFLILLMYIVICWL